jgi:hypothetical protein
MLHPDVAYDIASGHGTARLAQAATIAQARAARRGRGSSCGRRVCGLLSMVWLSPRPRTGWLARKGPCMPEEYESITVPHR